MPVFGDRTFTQKVTKVKLGHNLTDALIKGNESTVIERDSCLQA